MANETPFFPGLPGGFRTSWGDGLVGKLLKRLNCHPYRTSHMDFMIIAEGFDTSVTAFYLRGDRFEPSDAVFGVKSSLIVYVKNVPDEEMAKKYGVSKVIGSLIANSYRAFCGVRLMVR